MIARVRLVATMMVRDERDIIVPMIEHHLDQGVDLIIVTDNGSVDGTTEVLQHYADMGAIELHHDPVHRKQQGVVVTGMARRAYTVHGADWVINADADEFLVPLDRSLTVREALERTPRSLVAFEVPVVNLVSPPAERGSGIDRLVWRDLRTTEELVEVGIHAQPTPNAIHIGDPDVTVAQGNHFVSLESAGQPDDEVGLEVLHLPWRSWSQFERKVLAAGRAYEASPDLRPSPNHHGMADYRRLLDGRLREAYAMRLPTEEQLTGTESYSRDPWLRDRLHELVDRARLPELLAESLDSEKDEPWLAQNHQHLAHMGARFMRLEHAVRAARDEAEALRRQNRELKRRMERVRSERDALKAQVEEWVPVSRDVRRVGRRVAAAVKRRVVR